MKFGLFISTQFNADQNLESAMRGLFETYRAALPPGKYPEMLICQEYFIGCGYNG